MFEKIISLLRNPIVVFVAVSASQLLDNMNLTTFITSVKEVQAHFNVSYSTASWVLSAYSVTFASFIMFFGRVGDILSARVVYITGLYCLGIFCVISAAVDNIYVLIVFRALQGIAASATVPTAYAIMTNTFSGRALKLAIGGLTMGMILALGFGAVLGGGFSMTSIGYKGSLYVIAGCSLVSATVSVFAFEPVDQAKRKNVGSMKTLDYIGVCLFISGAVLLVTGFIEAGEKWNSPRAYIPLVIGAMLVILFFVWEKVLVDIFITKPIDLMIPHEMWKVKNFKVIPVISFFAFAGYFATYLLVVSYLLVISQDSYIIAALKFAIPQNFSAVICLLIIFVTSHKVAPKTFCLLGTLMGTIGAILNSRTSSDLNHYYRFELPGIILVSCGAVAYFINYLNLIIFATPLEMQGLISGICLTAAQFGTAIVFSAITSILGESQAVDTDAQLDMLATKYKNAMYLPIAVYGAAFLGVAVLVKGLDPEDMAHSREIPVEDDETSSVTAAV